MTKVVATAGVTVTGTAWRASVRPRGQGADWDNARVLFRDRAEHEWVQLMTDSPDVQHRLLGDIYREVKALAERESGNPRIGRRPNHVNGTMDEINDLLTPRFAMEAFAESVQVLIAENGGVRAFSRKAKMNHTALIRMVAGSMVLEMWRLEAIALAASVHPAYFKEWREIHVLTSIAEMLEGQPHLSITFSKALLKVQQNGRSRG